MSPLALLLLAAAGARAGWMEFTPQDLPAAFEVPRDWTVFEEPEPFGSVARALAPLEPGSPYRAGLSVRWVEPGQPHYKPVKAALKDLERGEELTRRSAGASRRAASLAGLARFVEIRETRRLPLEGSPSRQRVVHRSAAVVPVGEAYFLVQLSCLEEDHAAYRETFLRFLRGLRVRR